MFPSSSASFFTSVTPHLSQYPKLQTLNMLFTKTVLLALVAVAFAAPIDTTTNDVTDLCSGKNSAERQACEVARSDRGNDIYRDNKDKHSIYRDDKNINKGEPCCIELGDKYRADCIIRILDKSSIHRDDKNIYRDNKDIHRDDNKHAYGQAYRDGKDLTKDKVSKFEPLKIRFLFNPRPNIDLL
jgi:hypothetical protein